MFLFFHEFLVRIHLHPIQRYCGSIVGSLPAPPRGTNSSAVKRRGGEKVNTNYTFQTGIVA